MAGKKVSMLLTALAAFVIMLSTVSEGIVVGGDCTFTTDDGSTSEGVIYANLYVCHQVSGNCGKAAPTQVGSTVGDSPLEFIDIAIRLDHCDFGEGWYDVYFQTDTSDNTNPIPDPSDGKCIIPDAYNIVFETEEFCKSECMDDGRDVYWVPATGCCGDDGIDDMWQEGDKGPGCSQGTFYLDPDNDLTGVLCNFDDSIPALGVDCFAGNTQPTCWYFEPDPACCGDDDLEYPAYGNDNVACCPRNNDFAAPLGVCIPQSTYLHPTETHAADTTALGSEVDPLTEGELHPYNQTVTLLKAGGDPLFEIEGQFSALDRPGSVPPTNTGFVDLSGLRIIDNGASVYFNFTWLRDSRPSNRISDEYTVYIPNINFGIGITVCVDPQDPFTEAEYGDECETATEFTRPRSASGFTVEITEDYYKITTNLEDRYDWYAFVHAQPSLNIESEADLMTKRSFETVGFYAELKSGGAVIPDAACKIFYHDETNYVMEYNESFEKYYHERTYSGKGTYEWEVICSHPFYLPVSTSATASIKPNSELIIYDITDSKTKMINETVDFFAFFRGLPEQNLINTLTTSCNITFHEETSKEMDLDIDDNGEEYFTEDRKYRNYGTFSYVVKCAEDGYDTMTTIDVVEIFPTTCNVTRSDDEVLIAGKANFNIISKRGFVLLKKAG